MRRSASGRAPSARFRAGSVRRRPSWQSPTSVRTTPACPCPAIRPARRKRAPSHDLQELGRIAAAVRRWSFRRAAPLAIDHVLLPSAVGGLGREVRPRGIGPVHTLLSHPGYSDHSDAAIAGARANLSWCLRGAGIVELQMFARVQSQLKERNLRITPPRVVSGPILLTGLAVRASCHCAMTRRNGSSKSGQVPRYCTCSTCAWQGRTVCKRRSIAWTSSTCW